MWSTKAFELWEQDIDFVFRSKVFKQMPYY